MSWALIKGARAPLLRAGLAAVAVIGVVIALLGPEPGLLADQDSYSALPSGHRLAHDLLRDLGRDVRRWRRMPGSLGDAEGALLLLEPDAESAGGHERFAQDLVDWAARGHVVIVTPRRETIVAEQFKSIVFEQAQPQFGAGLFAALAEAAGCSVQAGGVSRDEAREPPRHPATVAVPGGAPLEFAAAMRSAPVLTRIPDDAELLATVNGEPFAIRVPHGAGALVFLAAADPFRNEAAARGDTPVFLVRLLEAAAPAAAGPLYLDEFFHGYTAATGLLDLALSPHLRLLVLQLLLLAALWAWSRGPRFGPLRNPAPPARRSKAEHVAAMAQLLDRGRAAPAAAARLWAGLLADLRAQWRLPDGASGEEVAQRLERSAPELAASLRALQAELPLRAGRGLRRQDPLVAFARRCQDLRTLSSHATRRRTVRQRPA